MGKKLIIKIQEAIIFKYEHIEKLEKGEIKGLRKSQAFEEKGKILKNISFLKKELKSIKKKKKSIGRFPTFQEMVNMADWEEINCKR